MDKKRKIISFYSDIAEEVGANASVLFKYISFWINRNRANKRNYKNGKYWMYNTLKQISQDIGYLTIEQVRYALNKLIDKGYIVKAELNGNPYDHTKWYSLTEKGESLQEQEPKQNTSYQANHKAGSDGYNASEYLEAAMNDLLYIGEVEVKKKE